jgi:hypothetical protein
MADLKPFEEEIGATPIQQLIDSAPQLSQQQPPPQSMMMEGPPQQMQHQPSQQQMMMEGHPQQMMMEGPPQLSHQQPPPMQQGHYNPYDQSPQPQEIPQPHFPEPKKKKVSWKSKMDVFTNCKSSSFKELILIVCIFVLLNSKIVYRELSKLPMMGTMDPSLLALLLNSVLAGIVFIIIKSVLI